jgi:hypothetical protein
LSSLKKHYKFQATYQKAKEICEKESMSLLSFDSAQEVSRVSDYINYIGTSVTN